MKRMVIGTMIGILGVATALAGCSSKDGSTTSSPSAPSSASPKSSAPASASPAGAGKYDPPITLTTVRKTVPTVKFQNGDTIDNNAWTRAYEKNYGIKIKTLWSVDNSQWDQKMNLTIASGELPDFFEVNPTQFKQLVDAGSIADLTDVYAKAPDGIKKLLTEGGDRAMKSATVNGKLMAIPFTGNPKESVPVVWVRTDWLKKLNLPEPKTMADLLAISEAFATKDPDGNGKQDTFGLALDKDFTLLNGFFNSYHAYPDIWIKDASGNLMNGSIQPELKKALQQLQTMFKGKQIDPEFGTKDFTKVAESLTSGKTGMFYFPFYGGNYPLISGVTADPNMEWKAYPIPSIDGSPAKAQIGLGVNAYWVVKKGVKNPEAIIKLLDFWLQTFYENKSPDVTKEYLNDGNSEIWQVTAIQAYKSYKNIDQRLKVLKALDSKDTSQLTGDDQTVYGNLTKFLGGDRSMWGWNSMYGKDGSLGILDGYRQNDQYMADEFITSPLPSMVDKGAALTKLKNDMITKIILGAASVDEFDSFVANWKKSGGDDITKEVNQWYAKNK